jgi:hypothetical protein
MDPLASNLEPRRSSIVGRFSSLWRTQSFWRKQVWIWPLLAAPLIALFGYYVYASVEASLRDGVREELKAVLNADLEALRIWMNIQQQTAQSLAAEKDVVSLAEPLITLSQQPESKRSLLADAPEAAQLRDEIYARTKMRGYIGYVLTNADLEVVASSHEELIGKKNALADPMVATALRQGKAMVTRPSPSVVILDDMDGQMRAGVPTMFAVAPILREDKQMLGAIGLRIRPETDFTRILKVGNFGASGETYAFDAQGVMLSRSRFEDDLKRLALIADKHHVTAVNELELRDPGVNLLQHARPVASRKDLPLTKMAASAIAGQSGDDVRGYRDYRGVMVVGAWQWLPEYGFGVATEIDADEAFRPAGVVRRMHRSLFALLGVLTLAVVGATFYLSRTERKAREAAIAAKKVGQYHLEDKLGQGGMGVVYRGKHALLRRPTAIKLLDPARTNEDSISRFEREVRLTSQLNHPNTITIYDYGRTDEGVFFYAMELLEGLDLETLVQRYGAQPPARVVHLLAQICGSLAEAHRTGLIHRDIKPGNIMLTQRGGVCDYIKVLDFGLVKAVSSTEKNLTAYNSLTGTPLYMSPEGIERPDEVDARSDLYAVGAVGYFLLTGKPVFPGESVVEICMQQVTATPKRPSERLGRELPAELEDALLQCLAKTPADRPQSAAELAKALKAMTILPPWTDGDAEKWWSTYTNIAVAETRDAATQRLALETQVIS